jgi:hypothetical protein
MAEACRALPLFIDEELGVLNVICYVFTYCSHCFGNNDSLLNYERQTFTRFFSEWLLTGEK